MTISNQGQGEQELCTRCEGNGVVKISGGVSVCDRCKGRCYEPGCPSCDSLSADVAALSTAIAQKDAGLSKKFCGEHIRQILDGGHYGYEVGEAPRSADRVGGCGLCIGERLEAQLAQKDEEIARLKAVEVEASSLRAQRNILELQVGELRGRCERQVLQIGKMRERLTAPTPTPLQEPTK